MTTTQEPVSSITGWGGTTVRQAVILAGGQASRLRPYTDHIPKALVEVAGRPIFEVEHNGQTHHVAVTIGKNGFIVGANIKGEDNPFKGAKPDPKYQGDGVYRR